MNVANDSTINAPAARPTADVADPQANAGAGSAEHKNASHQSTGHQSTGDRGFHKVMLTLSVSVLVASAVLTVQSERFVVIPLLDIPLPELCAMQRTLDLPCPGCGLTRCFVSLGHGQLGQAARFNMVGILLFAVVVLQVPYRALQLYRIRQGLPEYRLNGIAGWGVVMLALAMIVQWVILLLWERLA